MSKNSSMVNRTVKPAEATDTKTLSSRRLRGSTSNAAASKSSNSSNADTVGATKRSAVKGKSPSRSSPSRNKSPPKSKSPARIKSPARTRSPGRKPTSEATDGDKPKRKLTPKIIGSGDIGKITLRKPISSVDKKIDLDFSGSDEEILPKEKPKATVRGRTRNLENEEVVQTSTTLLKIESSDNYTEGVRRITRSWQPQEERVVHLKTFEATRKFGEFSDDDETLVKPDDDASKPKGKTPSFEYISSFFQIIFGPVFLLALHVACNKTSCTFTAPPDFNKFATFGVFFDLRSCLGYALLAIFVALASAFPYCGKKLANLPSKQGKFVYNCNGAFCLIITIAAWIALEYRLFSISRFVVEHFLHLAVSAIIFTFVLSLYLYLRSFYVPITALNVAQVDKSGLSAFLHGKEVNPRLLDVLDLKIFITRLSTCSLVIYEISHLLTGLNLNGHQLQTAIMTMNWKAFTIHPTLLVLVLMHVLYHVNYTIFESRLLSTYFFQYEGLGFSVVLQNVFYPFFWALQTKYVIEHKINLPPWALYALVTLYACGYVLSTLSNRQKDEFRRNPYSARSSKMETISTSQGRKILCSGCWGVLRQPNILGDILMHVSMLGFSYDVPLLIGFLGLIFALVERATSSQADCKKKYGSAWEKYCQKVKYVLIPKVY